MYVSIGLLDDQGTLGYQCHETKVNTPLVTGQLTTELDDGVLTVFIDGIPLATSSVIRGEHADIRWGNAELFNRLRHMLSVHHLARFESNAVGLQGLMDDVVAEELLGDSTSQYIVSYSRPSKYRRIKGRAPNLRYRVTLQNDVEYDIVAPCELESFTNPVLVYTDRVWSVEECACV